LVRELLAEEPPADERVLGASKLPIGPIAEAATKGIAHEQSPGQDGRPNRGPEAHGQVRPGMVPQAVAKKLCQCHKM
jgi:hypothetical protein